MPEWLNMVKAQHGQGRGGFQDLPLNISRDHMQRLHQLCSVCALQLRGLEPDVISYAVLVPAGLDLWPALQPELGEGGFAKEPAEVDL